MFRNCFSTLHFMFQSFSSIKIEIYKVLAINIENACLQLVSKDKIDCLRVFYKLESNAIRLSTLPIHFCFALCRLHWNLFSYIYIFFFMISLYIFAPVFNVSPSGYTQCMYVCFRSAASHMVRCNNQRLLWKYRSCIRAYFLPMIFLHGMHKSIWHCDCNVNTIHWQTECTTKNTTFALALYRR